MDLAPPSEAPSSLSEGHGGARNDEVVALDHALGVELQFVIDRLVDAVHLCQASISRPVDREAEDIRVGRAISSSVAPHRKCQGRIASA
jgi:hypothetical protein